MPFVLGLRAYFLANNDRSREPHRLRPVCRTLTLTLTCLRDPNPNLNPNPNLVEARHVAQQRRLVERDPVVCWDDESYKIRQNLSHPRAQADAPEGSDGPVAQPISRASARGGWWGAFAGVLAGTRADSRSNVAVWVLEPGCGLQMGFRFEQNK